MNATTFELPKDDVETSTPFTGLLAHVREAAGIAQAPSDNRLLVSREEEVRISESSFDIGPVATMPLHFLTEEVHGVILSPVSGTTGKVDAIFRLKAGPGRLKEVYGGTFVAPSDAYTKLKNAVKANRFG